MAKKNEQIMAIKLRSNGHSYSQIKEKLGVSKSTLSIWLRNYPLSNMQLNLLRVRERRIETFRETMKAKREKKLKKYYQEARESLLPLTKRELLLAGLFLYWGEGTKVSRGMVLISNTDPAVIKFAIYWLVRGLDIPRDSIKVRLHLYDDMDVKEITRFWSHELRIPQQQFGKTYIKKSKLSGLTQKGFGHGTCNIVTYNTEVKERILMALQVMADQAENEIANM